MDIIANLEAIKQTIEEELTQVNTLADVKAMRTNYLGKKGPITEALR